MPSLNKLQIIGQLSKNPELRFTPNGRPVCSFTIPVNRYFQSMDGERKQDTDWFTVATWNRQAESCNQFLKKGSLVMVEGRVKLHSWDGQDGEKKSRLELIANRVIFLSKVEDNSKSDGLVENEQEPDDIPF